jgi:amidase
MLNKLSLSEMSALIQGREISPVELVEAHLRQIEAHNPKINAFVCRWEDQAREQARLAEQALSTKAPIGPLHGVPLTVKDSFDVAGACTLCGSRFRLAASASQDSAAVSRLRAAGAILLGKTNCPEFLMNYETDNLITGRTNNPWDLERTPGGSSGGESAAIASFMSAGGMGSDGGGSIRVPAHCAGIAGLKPTPGRVSAAGHFPEISHPGGLLGVAGPMARTAADVHLLFEVVAGYDTDDPFSVPIDLRPCSLEGVVVGFMEQFCDVPVQAEVKIAVRKAIAALESVDIAVEPFRPPGLEDANRLWWFFFGQLPAPLLRVLIDGREDQAHWTGTELLERAERQARPNVMDVLQALLDRDRLRASILRHMRHRPLLLLPAFGAVAPKHKERTWPTDTRPIEMLEAVAPVTAFNLLGFPAAVIPYHLTPDGLPVGIQIVGRPWEEELVLALAEKLEQLRGPFPGPPGY